MVYLHCSIYIIVIKDLYIANITLLNSANNLIDLATLYNFGHAL